MKLAVLMDDVKTLKTRKDSTIAMLKASMKCGLDTCFFTINDLSSENGQAFANVYSIEIGEAPEFAILNVDLIGKKELSEFDIILMRKDPPFDMEYIFATYALELAEKTGVLIANKPQSLRDCNEKYFTLQFPECCPKTLVSRDINALKEFHAKYKNVIYKPLEGMGGKSVFRVDNDKRNLQVILETLTNNQNTSIMAQLYIPEISTHGDKRILMINGKPIDYALARIPKDAESRGNLAAGAVGKVVKLTKRDKWIAEQVGKTLKDKGLYFVGLDVIGDYLTEINVTSPTCIREIEAEVDIDIASIFIKELISRVC